LVRSITSVAVNNVDRGQVYGAASALLPAVAAAPPLHLDTRAVTQDLSYLTVAVVRAPPSRWPSPIPNKDWDQSDVGVNLNAMVELGVKYIEEAAAAGATVVAFPECWFPGYPKGALSSSSFPSSSIGADFSPFFFFS
jgi:hypothetical protein